MDKKKSSSFLKYLSYSIILVFFRFYICGLLGLNAFARVFLFLPMGLVFVQAFKHGFRKDKISFVLITCMLWSIAFILFLMGQHGLQPQEVLRGFTSTSLFILFPLLLWQLNLKYSEYAIILDRICLTIAFIGGPLVVLEYLSYFLGLTNSGRFSEFLVPQNLNKLFGDGYSVSGSGMNRTLGFLVDPSSSGIAITASIIYCHIRFQSAELLLTTKKYFFMIISSTIAVITCGSFVTLAIFGVIFLIDYFYRRPKVPWIKVLIASAIGCCIIYWSPLSDRYTIYYNEWELRSIQIIPILKDCSTLPLVGPHNLLQFCFLPEVHFFMPIFIYGLLPFLAYYFLVYAPTFVIFKKGLVHARRAPYFLFLVMIFSTVHYAGIDHWGNNYLFAIAALSLFSRES